MPATLDEILERIGETKSFIPNQAPPILVHGGKHQHIDLGSKKLNRQIVLVADEFKSEEAEERKSLGKSQMEGKLAIMLLVFDYPDRQSVESILDDLSAHFQMPLDKSKIIRGLSHSKSNTVFCLFFGVFEHGYYQ